MDLSKVIRGLLDLEGLTVEQLAIRARWSSQDVADVIEGRRRCDDRETAELLACFGLGPALEPLVSDFIDERVRTRGWTQRALWRSASNLARVSTRMHEQGQRLRDGAAQ